MSTENESIISGCNSLAALRHAAERNPHFRETYLNSMEPVKSLLSDVFERLSLKGKAVECYISATESDIIKLEEKLVDIDKTITVGEKLRKESLESHARLKEFYELLAEYFAKLTFLLDAVPQGDGLYNTVYNTTHLRNIARIVLQDKKHYLFYPVCKMHVTLI